MGNFFYLTGSSGPDTNSYPAFYRSNLKILVYFSDVGSTPTDPKAAKRSYPILIFLFLLLRFNNSTLKSLSLLKFVFLPDL